MRRRRWRARRLNFLGLVHDSVKVSIDSVGRDLVFDDVTVRVSPLFTLELHLDTDEANATGIDDTSTAMLLLS